jgi:hypothetical protein
VIMYIWTAPGDGAASFRRATGVSDDQDKAREAAEDALRSGRAGTVYIERVHTVTATPALSFRYVRSGTGWWARVGQSGRIVWTPYTVADERTTRVRPRVPEKTGETRRPTLMRAENS